MFLFSEYLRELVKKRNITISTLSRQTGIERTTLSKVLAGQRILPYKLLDKIIFQLRLTPTEEKKLRHFYEMQFDCEGIQEARKIIDKVFLDLANFDFSTQAFGKRKLLLNIDQYVRERTIFSGDMNVKSLLSIVLSDELSRPDARIELTIPPHYGFLNDELLRRYLEEHIEADITQIIMFDYSEKTNGINLHNLKCFCHILPYCLLSHQQYHAYYYYDNNVQHHYVDPFPYFLVTHSYVICLAENGCEAMLLRSEGQVSYYHNHFQKLLEQCYSLIQYTVNPFEVVSAYSQCTDGDGFYMIMDQPCFGRFYTDDFIDAHIHENLPHRELLLEAAIQRFGILRNAKNFYTFFTKKGLNRFRETGTLDDFPTSLVSVFTPEERKDLMLQMAKKTVSGDIVARVLEPDVFPDYLSMTTSVHSGVGFFITSEFPIRSDFFSLHLREPSLCQAFHEWLLHLADSRQSLNAEDTAQVLIKIAKAE